MMNLRNMLATAAFGCLLATSSTAETLGAALASAYENSGLLEQNRALLRAADEDVAIAVAATLPVINWAVRTTAVSPGPTSLSPGVPSAANPTPEPIRNTQDVLISTTAEISASLTLYDGGANQLAIAAQKELVLSTRETLRQIEQEVLLRAVQAYMDVRRNSEFVALRENNVRLITQELRAANDRFEVGEVTRTDVSLAEARLAAARSLLAAAQGNLAQSAAEFEAAVGRKPSGLTPVNPAPLSRTLADAQAFAVRNHPNVLGTQFSVSAAELNIRRAEAAYNPNLSISGALSLDDNLDASRSLSLSMGGPIYQGGRLSAQVRQVMARRDAARAGLHVTTQQIKQQVANSYAFFEVARASRQASDQQTRAATVAFRGVREEATLGARTTLDVLNAEQELLDARANVISAQADEVIGSYSVLSAMGLLTAAHLKLPVQQYDPAAYYNLVKDAPTITSDQGQALDRVLRAIGKD